jgi:hypothetical protein
MSTLISRCCRYCEVVSYCGDEHQSSHRPKHQTVCSAISKTRGTLEREKDALLNNVHVCGAPPISSVFETSVGRFGSINETKGFMEACFAAAYTLLQANTLIAVEKALGHFFDMLRLDRRDYANVRQLIPILLLRLDREQDCYDFIKWCGTLDDIHETPFLNIRGANVFEPAGAICFDTWSLSLGHLVTFTLLKLRLLLDLKACQEENESGLGDFGLYHLTHVDRQVGRIVRAKVQSSTKIGLLITLGRLKTQYRTLCQAVQDRNPYFWNVLVGSGELEPLPASYTRGSLEEAQVVAR